MRADERLSCCRLLRLEELEEGTVICAQGDVGHAFYIVLRGAVEVRIDSMTQERLSIGASFGKLSLLGETDEQRTLNSTIVAGPACVCALLTREQYHAVRASVRGRLASVLSTPFLNRTHDGLQLVADMLREGIKTTTATEQEHDSSWAAHVARHACLLQVSGAEPTQLPRGSFLLGLENQTRVEPDGPLIRVGEAYGVEALWETRAGAPPPPPPPFGFARRAWLSARACCRPGGERVVGAGGGGWGELNGARALPERHCPHAAARRAPARDRRGLAALRGQRRPSRPAQREDVGCVLEARAEGRRAAA